MQKGRATGTTTGSKKAAEPKRVNAEMLESTTKRTNFQMVAVGACPHDNSELLPPTRTKGEGAKAVCSKCGHEWYINKKIRTCKCLTCSSAKEKPQRMELVERGGTRNFGNKNGGPFWARTRDLSLIRTAL